jgi:hypothetical protein
MATRHPHLHSRGTLGRTPAGAIIRVMACIPEERLGWLEQELPRDGVTLQIGQSIDQVVSALCEDPPPRPQILIVDLDALGGGELMHLHLVRERGWFGKIIALGHAPAQLVMSLGVACVIGLPCPAGALARVVDATEFIAPTTRIPVLSG